MLAKHKVVGSTPITRSTFKPLVFRGLFYLQRGRGVSAHSHLPLGFTSVSLFCIFCSINSRFQQNFRLTALIAWWKNQRRVRNYHETPTIRIYSLHTSISGCGISRFISWSSPLLLESSELAALGRRQLLPHILDRKSRDEMVDEVLANMLNVSVHSSLLRIGYSLPKSRSSTLTLQSVFAIARVT